MLYILNIRVNMHIFGFIMNIIIMYCVLYAWLLYGEISFGCSIKGINFKKIIIIMWNGNSEG